MPVCHWSTDSSKRPLPMGCASDSGRKYATSAASRVNWRQAVWVRDGLSWNEHSFHFGLMWRCGWLPSRLELTWACGWTAVCAAAEVWIEAMASATPAMVSFLYIMVGRPASVFGRLPNPVSDGIAMVNDRKLGVPG